jgi:hypothetical protein
MSGTNASYPETIRWDDLAVAVSETIVPMHEPRWRNPPTSINVNAANPAKSTKIPAALAASPPALSVVDAVI